MKIKVKNIGGIIYPICDCGKTMSPTFRLNDLSKREEFDCTCGTTIYVNKSSLTEQKEGKNE